MTQYVDNNILVMEKISKAFPGVKALTDVDFTLRRGEVHALLGENGAGKSTLINILSGSLQPDSGSIRYEGMPVTIETPKAAQLMGISTIHQELKLIQKLSVAENVFFGRQPKKMGLVDSRKMTNYTEEICRKLGIDIDANEYVKNLSLANQQMVEIIRTVSFNAKIVIMDEPTSSLTMLETEILFNIIRTLTEKGVGIIFITHRLEEIFEIADRLTVLRDGQYVDTVNVSDVDKNQIITMMVGRELKQQYPPREQTIGDVHLQVENISDGKKIQNASFVLHKSEVLGFSGLVGAGRTELMRLIFGADPIISGRVLLDGRDITATHPRQAIQSGMGLVTEDRKGEGIILKFPVKYNIVMVALEKIKKWGMLNNGLEMKASEEYVKKMRISTPSSNQKVMFLSGGNQQKVVLSKWLFSDADIIILDEPTRGIDVGAKRDIYELINELIKEGKSIIVVSSEMEEIMGICDRILVMREGHIVGQLKKKEFSQTRIMQYAMEGDLQ